ncbi:MAG: carboxylesterase family protein [Saprospiraceae bacterium]|nr:carboxylesterase family protein [Saprospiraceae bacterium]MCB9319907.1 carboxylesterase family protein [Lewinellaceae bacterium]
MQRWNFMVVLLLGVLTLNAQSNDAFAVRVTTDKGVIEGNYEVKTGLQQYFGIPYAKPPVYDLRWKAPQPMDPWDGVKTTKKFGPRAVQAAVFGDMDFRSDGISEDCLYLNVWTPAKHNTTGLPVLVYFYGGGNVAGDGSEPRYDGASMAQKGMVVVTVNYRLNIFGFYAHPGLSAEAPYHASGNYGLLDQQASLQWVHDNIAAFGGDPGHVTIAGESAGSIGVSMQMASPLTKGLIAGAIGESGAGINPTMSPVPLSDAEKAGEEFAQKAGYTIEQLRAMSTREIYEIYQESRRFGFPAVLDGYFLPKSLPEIFNAGEQSKVPLLVGWNSSEIPGMAFMQGQPYTKEAYQQKVKEAYPNDYAEVLKLYPDKDAGTIEWSATALASDRFIAYSTWKWFDLARKNSSQPVFRYLYSRKRPPLVDQNLASGLAGGTVRRDANTPPPPQPIGAPHACEIEYCMGNLPLVTDYAWTADDYTVSKTMQQYFANFIMHGDPNGEGLPEWPAADAQSTTPPVMIIDVTSHAVKADNDARYQFLDKQYKNNK